MKITVYTITDCKFSQAEKQYLQSKQIQFEEKNLEANREYLTEMLNISNNFAGTPVTKIEKDDGQIIVLKGFTQDEFDKALAVDPNAPKQQVAPPAAQPTVPAAAAPMPQDQSMMPSPTPTPQPPIQTAPVMPSAQPMSPPVDTQPQMQMPIPPSIPQEQQPMNMQSDMNPMPPVQLPQPIQAPQPPVDAMYAPPAPPTPPANDQALNSVLQNLQNRAGDGTQ